MIVQMNQMHILERDYNDDVRANYLFDINTSKSNCSIVEWHEDLEFFPFYNK